MLSRWKQFNPNPINARVGDCTIRAICKALNSDWETVFAGVMVKACQLSDMPSANIVWSSYLREHGFKRYIIPNECPDDYTVNDFAIDHPYGTFVLALNGHVVAVVDGYFYDTWDSGNEIPLYYWSREG